MVMINYRLGGWVMSMEEALKWAARLSNKPVEEVDFDYAMMILLRHLTKRHIHISIRYPHHDWRRGDDPKKLEPCKMRKIDLVIGKAVNRAGIRDIQFMTADGIL
ncbi:hypothetical protein D9615_005043 [Tricholomella constricta]|uniref:Uncharacterized protein n=1 Tax=Tricholomella constricta TaxID=117010 RepID=A0A8H5HH77_9AGAR|nr:hypothetical protein D9615_005043 [Tricholomella constricta]